MFEHDLFRKPLHTFRDHALVLEAGELVLHEQLAPFQRNDLKIVDRWMSVRFGYFHFQCAMPSLQCFNMRFYGHIGTSPWPVAERASEGRVRPAEPSTRTAVCHVTTQSRMCWATGTRQGANLSGVLR